MKALEFIASNGMTVDTFANQMEACGEFLSDAVDAIMEWEDRDEARHLCTFCAMPLLLFHLEARRFDTSLNVVKRETLHTIKERESTQQEAERTVRNIIDSLGIKAEGDESE